MTDDEFGVFKAGVLRWVEVFGLNDWDVRVMMRIYDRMVDQDWMAQCDANVSGMKATISIGSLLPDDLINEKSLRDSAHHEVLELLLIELDPGKDHERHQVINRLIKVLLDGRDKT